jgi:hypothetical protein
MQPAKPPPFGDGGRAQHRKIFAVLFFSSDVLAEDLGKT